MIPPNLDLSLSDSMTVTDLWRDRLRTHTRDTYRGRLLSKFPEDLRVYEHIIENSAPDVIVELGSHDGGSALWFADRLQTFFGNGEVISVDVNIPNPMDRKDITFVRGDLTDPAIVAEVTELVGDRYAMVIEDSAHTYPVTMAALQLYSPLVHGGMWFVVEDGVVDEERLRLPGWPRGVQQAISDFRATTQGQRFLQHWLTPYGLTCHHGGWLRPVG